VPPASERSFEPDSSPSAFHRDFAIKQRAPVRGTGRIQDNYRSYHMSTPHPGQVITPAAGWSRQWPPPNFHIGR